MKKVIILQVCIIVFSLNSSAQLFSTITGFVGFYSKTPLEDVKAESNNALSVINITTRELAFSVLNTTFGFRNKLMQEHFNEKYIESEKFPTSNFKGKVNEVIDLSKDGVYKVTVSGKLNIHGVEQPRTIEGEIIVKNGKVELKSNFKVRAVDHNVKIPQVVMSKLAEEMDVSVDAVLSPKK